MRSVAYTLAAGLLLAHDAFAAITFNQTTGTSASGNVNTFFNIDTGSTPSFLVSVNASSGDIVSMQYGGVEYQNLQNNRASQVNTGLSNGRGAACVVDPTSGVNTYYNIQCTRNDSSVQQNYIFRPGFTGITMVTVDNSASTQATTTPFTAYELRMSMRLVGGEFKQATYNTSAIEIDGDFGLFGETNPATNVPVTFYTNDAGIANTTSGQYYSGQRFIDQLVYGLQDTTRNVGAYMVMSPTTYEKSSGGPFIRPIAMLIGRATSQTVNTVAATDLESDVFYYMRTGTCNTEAPRYGVHGPYSFVFTNQLNTLPAYNPNYATLNNLFTTLGLTNAAGRGTMSGNIGNAVTQQPGQYVVHWFNDEYEYWSFVNNDGSYTSPAMVTGDYNMNLYRYELRIAAATISITTGTNPVVGFQGVAPAGGQREVLWVIGRFDGQPNELKNGGEGGQLRMHPIDPRLTFTPMTYAVGAAANTFPMAQIYQINDPTTITFTLTSAQATRGKATFRLATTLQQGLARPNVTFNGVQLPLPPDPVVPPTTIAFNRGFTRGQYRGFNEAYDFDVPDGLLKTGSNNIQIRVYGPAASLIASTFAVRLNQYNNANFIYDALELFRDPDQVGV